MRHLLEYWSQLFVLGAIVVASLLTIAHEVDRLGWFDRPSEWVDVWTIRRRNRRNGGAE